jgi:hypothetical protein
MPGTVFLPPDTVIVPVAGVVGLPAMLKVNDAPVALPGEPAKIVPVAGVTGLVTIVVVVPPPKLYVKVVAPVTVIANVPLYAVGVAPAIVTCAPVW